MRLPEDLVRVITHFVTGKWDVYWVRLASNQRLRRVDVFGVLLEVT